MWTMESAKTNLVVFLLQNSFNQSDIELKVFTKDDKSDFHLVQNFFWESQISTNL